MSTKTQEPRFSVSHKISAIVLPWQNLPCNGRHRRSIISINHEWWLNDEILIAYSFRNVNVSQRVRYVTLGGDVATVVRAIACHNQPKPATRRETARQSQNHCLPRDLVWSVRGCDQAVLFTEDNATVAAAEHIVTLWYPVSQTSAIKNISLA